MSGKMSRTKGHGFERRIAKELRRFFPNAKRHLEVQESECYGVDLDNTYPFAFQIKRYKKYVPITKIKEIQLDRKCNFHVLVTKADNEPTMVAMYWDDFQHLMKAYLEGL